MLSTKTSPTTRAFMDIKNQCSGCCSTKVVRSWFHGILFKRLSLLDGQMSSMLNHKCWSTPNKFLMYARWLTTKSQVSLVRQTKLKLSSFKNCRVILYRSPWLRMLSVWAVIRANSFYWSQTVLLLLSRTRTLILVYRETLLLSQTAKLITQLVLATTKIMEKLTRGQK